ncbi:hypothetical protein ACIQUL_09010 [Streptomyces sp. NPDC090303]|uniref:hypothetical protein n=1 Tax=Streptomyces sp. NPDC090303 TaxID=3365960 RepID=UPI00380BFED4
MLPDVTDARTALETAQREAAEARALVDTLAERVRDGAEDITGEDIATQRQLAEFADLRVTAAERKLTAAVAADRDTRAQAAAARVRALVADDSTEALCDAARAVVAAVHVLVEAADERAAAIRDVAAEGSRINDELDRGDDDPWPSRQYGFMAQTSPMPSVTAVGEGRATSVPAHRLLGVVLASALLDHGSMRTEVGRAMQTPWHGIEAAAGNVAGLAEALRPATHPA